MFSHRTGTVPFRLLPGQPRLEDTRRPDAPAHGERPVRCAIPGKSSLRGTSVAPRYFADSEETKLKIPQT